MTNFLKVDAWKVFIILFMPFLITSIGQFDHTMTLILSILTYTVYIGWYLLIGTALNDELTNEAYRSNVFFKINCFYLLGYLAVSTVLGEDWKSFEATEYVAVLSVYNIVAFIHIIYFTTSSFLRLLDEKKVQLSNKKIAYLHFLIPFIGVWFITTTLKKLD